MRPSSIPQPRISPVLTSQQLRPLASTSRRREDRLALTFSYSQVFQRRECWPIRVAIENPTVVNEGQDFVARLFRRFGRNSREVIMYANDGMIPGIASEEMAPKFVWHEDQLINYFQSTFDDLGRDK
ncbi:hypothetical protein O181_125564 [Austropuccinia psidii MF-1]|uniref:Uncharacterized protein n=1 Tax=Austropuccinia psidii MF-1 TaxID=1389203 RepID=A0A9Q3KUD0_9BASI|nr:hypothetical protein [Austropuccinia psidii MF-1]